MTSRLSWEIDYLKNDLSFCQYQTVKRSFFVLTCADRLVVSLISMFRSEFHDAVFPSVTASFAYNTFNIIGVAIDETIINKITDVKYTGVSSPAESPFCDTISATSPHHTNTYFQRIQTFESAQPRRNSTANNFGH